MENNGVYEGMSRDDLLTELATVEKEILGYQRDRREINQREDLAHEHRDAIVRALGCVVLSDHRYQ